PDRRGGQAREEAREEREDDAFQERDDVGGADDRDGRRRLHVRGAEDLDRDDDEGQRQQRRDARQDDAPNRVEEAGDRVRGGLPPRVRRAVRHDASASTGRAATAGTRAGSARRSRAAHTSRSSGYTR